MATTHNRLAKLALALTLGIVSWVPAGCGGKVSTNTNFGAAPLEACDKTAQCGSGLACRCGICTVECTSDADCEFEGVEGVCSTKANCEAVPLCFLEAPAGGELVAAALDASSSPSCGDGVWDEAMGEECDPSDSGDSGLLDACNVDCTLSRCGDGKIGPNELCDPATVPACSQDCSHLENCGDGKVDKGEECDPTAGGSSPALCTPTCKNRGCGNGVVDQIGEFDEACDDGNTVAGDGCSANCKSREVCGNNIIDRDFQNGESDARWEVCDDGNTSDGDLCSKDCTISAGCGNGEVDPGEDCDNGKSDQEGRTIQTAECNTDCRTPLCGDGIINTSAGENCDKSTPADTEECNGAAAIRPDYSSVACQTPLCGDQYVNAAANEQCEPVAEDMDEESGDTQACNGTQAPDAAKCRLPKCGDGYVNEQAGEKCEPSLEDGFNKDTKDSPTCNGNSEATPEGARCKKATCGDGYTNHAAGEACDEGPAETAECNRSTAAAAAGVDCLEAKCGDGYVNRAAEEDCEPGLNGEPVNEAGDSASCNGPGGGEAACKQARCGDGYTNLAAAECGDAQGDSAQCNASTANKEVACKISRCGDSYVNPQAKEACDPGSTDTAACNGQAAGELGCQPAACGDGYVNAAADEECEPNSDTDSYICNGPSAGVVACRIARCGDGYCNPDSEYGGLSDPDAGIRSHCLADCQ